jgi:hypothetical protein
MKITQQIIKQIIKEEIQKVLGEDLYASDSEYKEAIEQFMKDHNVSRAEAKKAIDAAGEEMDEEFPVYKIEMDAEKSDNQDYEFFGKMARYSMSVYGKAPSYDEIVEAVKMFKKEKFIGDYGRLMRGYEFCKNRISDPYGQYAKAGAAMKKLDKPFLQKDLGAAYDLSQLTPALKQNMKNRMEKCEEALGMAYIGLQRFKADNKEAEDRKKAKQAWANRDQNQDLMQQAIQAGYGDEAMSWTNEQWMSFHSYGYPG